MLKLILLAFSLFAFSVDGFAQASRGTIWFYRPADSPEPRNIPTVYENGGITRPLAPLRPGEFFGLSVMPGTYRYSYTRAPARGQYVEVQVSSGEDVFVEFHYREFAIVPPDKGIAALAQMRPISPESASATGLVLTTAPVASTAPVATTPTRASTGPPTSTASTVESPSVERERTPITYEPAPVSDGLGPRAGLVASFGYSRPTDINAFGVAGGGSFRWNRFIAFGTLDVSHRRSIYEFETFDNGQTVCRNKDNGQFSDFELCENNKPVTITGG